MQILLVAIEPMSANVIKKGNKTQITYSSSGVRVLVYVSFPFVRSDYVISAGIGFRVVSGVVASP